MELVESGLNSEDGSLFGVFFTAINITPMIQIVKKNAIVRKAK